MHASRTSLILRCGLLATTTLLPMPVLAQARPKIPQPVGGEQKIQTTVRVDLLTGSEGVGFKGQEWLPIFEELGVQLQIRQAVVEEKISVTEKLSGLRLRDVRVVGRLERDGTITVPGHSFSRSETQKLQEWLSGLQAYGAQGTPTGQPVWGLSRTQFEPLFAELGTKLPADPQGQTLDEALELFSVQKKFPFRFSAAATTHLARKQSPVAVRQSLAALSQGTALAILLNEYGLGFYPRRTPDAKLELALVTLAEQGELWPAGWQPNKPGIDIAPRLYDAAEIELDDEPLTDVLGAVGDLVKLPVLYDDTGLRSRQMDLSRVKVSHPKKKVPWSLALKRFTFQARCRWELRVDEAGQPFLWTFPEELPAKQAPPQK